MLVLVTYVFCLALAIRFQSLGLYESLFRGSYEHHEDRRPTAFGNGCLEA